MKEIKIVPIFNQTGPIWEDFLRIRVAAMRGNYNFDMPVDAIVVAMKQLNDSWSRLSFNFAFGAYYDGAMVGCIHGAVQNKIAKIEHLYVLPGFQGMHVGSGLMNATKSATSIGANRIELTALAGAETFYKHIGCKSQTGMNDYVADIRTLGRCSATPLFYCSPRIARACAKLSDGKFDANLINKSHLPAFIYRDVDSNITGFGILTDGKPICFTQSSRPDDLARTRLMRIMNAYNQNQK